MGKPIIGLVGGIGSGKSTVAEILADCGCGVIDADKLAHELLGGVVETIQEWWGDSVVTDDVPNRKEIAKIVFADADELKRLEGLLYPLIRRQQTRFIAEYNKDDSILGIVLDAPKLYEAGIDELCDAVIFIKTCRDTRISRAIWIRGWTESQLFNRETMQKSLKKKEESADYVVENDSTLGALRSQVEQVFSSILEGVSRSSRASSCF